MPLWVLMVLVVCVCLAAAAGLYALFATIRLFVGLNRLGKALAPVTDAVAAGAERLSARTEATAINLARLERSVKELRASRERLATLQWAFGDVLQLIRIARSLVPKK